MSDLAAARAFLSSVGAKSRRRGQAYYSMGAVESLERVGAEESFIAKVRGSQLYTVTLEYENGDWFDECSCPLGGACKHCVAAMLMLLARAGHGGNINTIQSGRASQSATYNVAPPQQKSGRQLKPELEKALGRALNQEEEQLVGRISALYYKHHRGSPFVVWDFKQLGFNVTFLRYDQTRWWINFPKDEVDFWQHLAYGLRNRGADVPKFLEAVSDDARVAETFRKWERQRELESWRHKLRNSFDDPPCGWQGGELDFRLVIAKGKILVEWKTQTDPQFRPLKSTQHKQMFEADQSGELAIAEVAFPIWQAISARYSYSSSVGISLFNESVRRALRSMVMLPQLRERIITAAGLPFGRPETPLRWTVTDAPSDDGDYTVRLTLPDGSKAPPIQLMLNGRPTLYFTDDSIYNGPPPIDFDSSYYGDHTQLGETEHHIPAPALETPEGIRFLKSIQAELPPRIRQRVRIVPIKVRATCDVQPTHDGGESELVFVKLVAEADGFREAFKSDGWVSVWKTPNRKAGKPSENQLEEYDRSAMNAVAAWMSSFGGRWDRYADAWTQKISKQFAEKFLAWLQLTPPNVEVLLDKQLATLRDAPLPATVRLDVKPAGFDWFDLKVVVDVADTDLTPEELNLLLNARGGYVRLGAKGWHRLQFNFTEDDNEQLARLGLSANDFSAEPQRLHALQLADDAAKKFLPEKTVEQVRRRAAELQTRVAPPVPDAIRAELRPYQIEGFHFLAYLTANNFGGILADDMGLGKTLQTLTWLTWLRSEFGNANVPMAPRNGGAVAPPADENPTATTQNPKTQPPKPAFLPPSLVVCPKSVVDNWRAESQKFAPHLRVRIWRGTDGEALTKSLGEADMFVVNYSQLRGLGDALTRISWHVVILDEGQYIKNPESQTAKVARSLAAQHRLVLTGTPIENRLMDLWSLMAFAMPGVLSNRSQFAKQFDQAADPFARRRLAARVRPFVLRRTKSQVAKDLPDRTEEDLLCEMEGEQQKLYRAELKRAQQMLLRVQTQKQFDKERFNFLTSLLRLRQICCHPALVNEKLTAVESAKVGAMLDLLEPLMEEGHKVLLFSQFVTMLDLLRPTIIERGWQHFCLTGATENRGELVQQFQNADGAALFLISLKAGGFGLNLTAASYVVLFDPWWNPAVEMQAIDRTHRIGQTQNVTAYRLLIKDSVEEKIRKLQVAKRALAEDVLGEENFAKALTLDDLKFLFSDDTL